MDGSHRVRVRVRVPTLEFLRHSCKPMGIGKTRLSPRCILPKVILPGGFSLTNCQNVSIQVHFAGPQARPRRAAVVILEGEECLWDVFIASKCQFQQLITFCV
jgi:hypothetical protein